MPETTDTPTPPETPVESINSSTFNTKVPGFIKISKDDDSTIFSTMQFGNHYGEITKLDLGREAEEILAQGGWNQLIGYFLTNFSYSISVEVIMRKGVTPPGPGDQITFPLAGVKGVVKPGVKMGSSNNSVTTMSFEAASWDSLDNGGAGSRTVTTPPASIAQTV